MNSSGCTSWNAVPPLHGGLSSAAAAADKTGLGGVGIAAAGGLDVTLGDHVIQVTLLYWIRMVAMGFTLFVLCTLTIVGNAMVLHAVRTDRRLQTVSGERRSGM